MSDPMQALMQPTPLTAQLFGMNSRYASIATATLTRPDGTTIVYLRRRFCPDPDRMALLLEHSVSQGERLDNITAHYLGDPELFWRVCDANNVLAPEELETLGRLIRITLPEGIPGTPNP
jgi:hypothetical protein